MSETALASAYLEGIGEEAKRRVHAFDAEERDVMARTALVDVLDLDALRSVQARQLGTDALAALVLVPLREVAWQSAESVARKGAAMRQASAALGLETADFGSDLLLRSIEAPNDAGDITSCWQALFRALVGTLDADALSALQWELTDRAWLMASTLYGADASHWPKQAFQALRALESAFCERATGAASGRDRHWGTELCPAARYSRRRR